MRRSGFVSRLVIATMCSGGIVVGAQASPAAATPPTAAIAIGDSFISGEGAGAYNAVVDAFGVAQGFPGWSAANSNAFFCHRSANASIEVAALAGIDARFNLACSGGRPHDMANPSYNRPNGRGVAAQIDQMRQVAQTHDIDLVLIGLGSNNSSFTFGSSAEKCVNQFITDAWVGWWEFWTWFTSKPPQRPCTNDDLAAPGQFAAAQAETTNAARQILTALNEIDADGQHRVVFQDYTNPLPTDYHPDFHTQDGRSDTRDKFRDLGAERYGAGCPAHRGSLGPAHWFSQNLGSMVAGVHATMKSEFPAKDLVYLNVQRAFDGARLCENANSPTNTLATPVRLQDGPNGSPVTSLWGRDKTYISRLAETCTNYFQTCQESWHPNAAGHAVLGQCLTGAWQSAGSLVDCSRSVWDGSIYVSTRQPYAQLDTSYTNCPYNVGYGVQFDLWYSVGIVNVPGETIASVTVDGYAYDPALGYVTLPQQTTTTGAFSHVFPPDVNYVEIYLTVTVVTSSGRTLQAYGGGSAQVTPGVFC
jgi:hypothetical protein